MDDGANRNAEGDQNINGVAHLNAPALSLDLITDIEPVGRRVGHLELADPLRATRNIELQLTDQCLPDV